MIRVESLSTHAGAFALRDISFDVPAGSWTGVVGAAGAGKTTLLECIAGLHRASGTVTLGNRDVTALPPEDRGASLVYQNAYLFPHLDVRANVCYGAATEVEARDLADRLGLSTLWNRDVRTLSGGERQLVALARALARPSSVWLLDEPFASLDYALRPRVRTVVRELSAERGATVLFVTHDLAEAEALGERVIHLERGRVAASGPARDLLAALQAETTP